MAGAAFNRLVLAGGKHAAADKAVGRYDASNTIDWLVGTGENRTSGLAISRI